MSPVLAAVPTARPSCADDSDERTQFFRPNQKRPTWKDVERARGEVRSAPALRLVLTPDTLGPQRMPAAKPYVPPYLRPGYWKGEVKLGSELHAEMRREMGRDAAIRPCPPSIAKLLATPEWRGSTTRELTPSEAHSLKASAEHALQDAMDAVFTARGASAKNRARAHVEAHEARLARIDTALAVVHPAGAVLVWHPL
jgi:hypothetical protein